MLPKILHRFKEGGGGSEPGQQSASGLESEGSGASSEPTQVSLNPNPRPVVDQTSTGDDNNWGKAPTKALVSSFFSGATGTIVSGPAHFTSSSGAQVAVHIHQPANFMNTGEQLNPTVLPTPPPPLPVNTVNVIPSSSSNMGIPYASESTAADVDPPKDNEIYERLLRRKGRGFALYIPQPNRRLPIAYQRTGVRIGDVGIITPYEYFSPLQPALAELDVVEFCQFNPGSYLASASIEKKESDLNAKGLHFETSASEGAVLTMPEGAISLDLDNDVAFSGYLEANVRKWYEFVRRVRGKSICNGQIRLVIGCDKTTAWGIATVSGMSQQKTTKLKFKALDTASSSTNTYTWECSGMVEVRVGPDRREIEALRNHDDGGQPLDTTLHNTTLYNTTLHNQCLFVRTMTATLNNDDWVQLGRNLGKTTVEDPNTSSGITLDPPPLESGPSGSNIKSCNQPGSRQGVPGTRGCATGEESGIVISTMPDSSAPYHPSDDVNRQLLLKFPDCKMVITKDQDWLSTLTEDDEMVYDPEQLLEQILASHDVRIENGVLRLDRKKLVTPRSISSSFLSDHVWEETLSEDNSHTHVHHEKYYIPDGDLFIVVEQILFRVHGHFFRESEWFADKLSTPASPGVKPQGFDESTPIILDGLSSVDFAKFLGAFYNPRNSLDEVAAGETSAKADAIPNVSINGPDGSVLAPTQTLAVQPTVSTPGVAPTVTANPPANVVPAFRQFVTNERERLTQKHQALVKSDMDKRMAELVKFNQSFELNKPMPDDLVPISAKDEERQSQIKEKAGKGASSGLARAIGPSTPAMASRGLPVAGAKIVERKPVPQALVGKGGAAGATSVSGAPGGASAQKTLSAANAASSSSGAALGAAVKPAAKAVSAVPSSAGAKKIDMVIQTIPPFKGSRIKPASTSASVTPHASGAGAEGTPVVNAPVNTGKTGINQINVHRAGGATISRAAPAPLPISPNTGIDRLNTNALSFRLNPKVVTSPKNGPGGSGPNQNTPANAPVAAANMTSPKAKAGSAPGTPNPFFGTRPIKKSTPVHVKDDFNPFKHNKVIDASRVSAIWPYNGKRYMQVFPSLQHPPAQHGAYVKPPVPTPIPPPSYEEDSAAQAAAQQQHRGYVYYPPYGYPPQPMMPGMPPPGPPGAYMPGPYMQHMPYPPGMPPPNAMYSPAMGQMPPYMQPPPYPPSPNGAGTRPSMPPTPIPAHAHSHYHQSPQLQHAYPMMMSPPPNIPPHGYEDVPTPPVPMGGHA